MLFSTTTRYSIQAMLFLSANHATGNIRIKEMADRLNLSSAFLSKVLQTLTKFGFAASMKGPQGGFVLTEFGANSTIAQIVAVIEGPLDFTGCVAGFHVCSDANPCPFHARWTRIRREIETMVTQRTIAQLARQMSDTYRLFSLNGHKPLDNAIAEAPVPRAKAG